MRIDQITPSMRYGDDISNAVLTIQKIIKDIGCDSDILRKPGSKDVRDTARLLDHLVNDQAEREEIISRQSERATAFLPDKVFPLYHKAISQVF